MSERTHDKAIYLDESRYNNPKELFKLLGSRALSRGPVSRDTVVCDFGCAAGELLHYLSGLQPGAQYRGFDVVPEFIDKARAHVPTASFEIGSVLDRSLLPDSAIDVAYLIGVLGIFDDFVPVLDNLLRWTRKGGQVVIVAIFNPFPVDVWVKYRLAADENATHREPGWNLFSRASVERYLRQKQESSDYAFTPFQMAFDIPRHAEDPIRTWTFMDNGRRRLTNGLSLAVDLSVLTIAR